MKRRESARVKENETSNNASPTQEDNNKDLNMDKQGRYRRVSLSSTSTPAATDEGSSLSAEDSTQPRTIEERAWDKLWALGWVATAILVTWWTNFLHVILAPDPRISLPYLYAFVVGVGINTVLFLYLKVYLHYVVGLPKTDSSVYDVWCPRVIPTITITGVLCTFFIIRATYPIWGLLSPLVLGIEVMGALHFLHFVPWC